MSFRDLKVVLYILIECVARLSILLNRLTRTKQVGSEKQRTIDSDAGDDNEKHQGLKERQGRPFNFVVGRQRKENNAQRKHNVLGSWRKINYVVTMRLSSDMRHVSNKERQWFHEQSLATDL